jgi:hypothetical protein
MVNNFPVVNVVIAQDDEYGLIVSTGYFAKLGEIERGAVGVDVLLHLLDCALGLEVAQRAAARRFHLIKLIIWIWSDKSISAPPRQTVKLPAPLKRYT